MKQALAAALLCLLVCPPLVAADPPASAASLKSLLSIMQASKLMDSTMSQMDGLLQSSMKQVMAGILKEGINWEKLEPMMIGIYQQSFTQKDVDGMLTFYKSKAGQAVIAKMPVVMPKIQNLAEGTAAKLKATQQAPVKSPGQ